MTGPGSPGNFEYRDDSVVARLSVDVPASTVTDLDQVRERIAAIRVENEANARATGDWAGYLQSLPQIIEQANQSYRNLITQLERVSYIQQEMGGHANVGVQGAPMGAQPGGTYSTAAPQGYVDPFMGLPGQGMNGMTGFMQSMMMNDPRMFANMAAQRGGYVNPAQLGLMGGQLAVQQGVSGGTGGGQGQGAPPPASTSPQATQSARDSAAPPAPNQSGQPTTSEPQNEPAEPHPDAPDWQKHLATAGSTAMSVLNETRAGTQGRGGIMGGTAALLGAIGRIGGHGGGGGGGGGTGGGGGGGTGGGGMGSWGAIAKGAGLAGTGIAAGMMVNRFVQNAGEQIQEYRNLGSIQGGGAVEGFGHEMGARVLAMNPYLTLEQSRAIYQQALRSGYTGETFDNAIDFMAENLKNMNMSTTESAEILRATVDRGNVSIQDMAKEMEQLKDLTRSNPTMTQEERNAAYAQTVTQMQGMGLEGPTLTSTVEGLNEAFSDNMQLKNSMPQANQSALSNPTFLSTMAATNGVTGINNPAMTLAVMQQQGVDIDQAYWKTLERYANMAYQGTGGDLIKGAGRFMMIVQPLGVNLPSPDDYIELYRNLLEGNVGERGARRGAEAAKGTGTIGEQVGGIAGVLKAPLNVVGAVGKTIMGNLPGAWDSLKAAGRNFTNAGDVISRWGNDEADIVAEQQRRQAAPPATGVEKVENRIRTEGNVTGEVRIVVDQQGRVTAPQSIQLSGQQKGVNAGLGNLTMNNPSPGDPSYRHAQGPFAQGPR
ncbi:tape measure protein [Mycobacterium phage ScoobyDoobyDoo]|nr:tape measure protein [Mycobacterium phage ScoobyDoobyDoo]